MQHRALATVAVRVAAAAPQELDLSLRTKTFLLFLAFVLAPLAAVGVVASMGTRLAVEQVIRDGLDPSVHSAAADLDQDAAESGSPARDVVSEGPTAIRTREGGVGGAVTSVSTDEVLAPLARVRLAYLALVLLVGAAATVGFQLVSRRIFRSLDEFRGAVEQIARGDFAPWLPPPGRDEVGWLSLSLLRMAERMGQMMQSVEQGGRLAVVGEMAAQVAHEVRTPLSSIKMNLQMLERSADAGLVSPDARVGIDTSLREIARLETTVTRILQFGAPDRGSRRRCSLHDLISEAADLVRGALERESIDLRLGLGAESDWILADDGGVKGVFLNLLINARDAMPQGGEVSVETQLFLGDGGKQMVAAAVSDSGAGVPIALREEVFHPFFTTKTSGSGIGLPAALRTLRQHGGDLYLSERPDGRPGACFVALFPLAPPNWVADVQGRAPDAIAVASLGGAWRRQSPLRWARVSEDGERRTQTATGEATAHLSSGTSAN